MITVEEGRSARKRRSIMAAAATLFLRNGYQGTSMDDIAALAEVSKQTVYKNFADKERLFHDVVLSVTGAVEDFLRSVGDTLRDTEDVPADLRTLGRRYLQVVMRPPVVQLRRMLIGESARFPELARTYYEQVPERVLTALAPELRRLHDRGLLTVPDPELAAEHFAFLILGAPLDRAMFVGENTGFTPEDLDRRADEGVRVFLAAYRPAEPGRPSPG